MSDINQTTQPSVSNGTEVKDDMWILNPSLKMFLLMLISVLSFKGVVTNTMNIIVFSKLRKNDPINISLLGLAISDVVVCLTTLFFFLGTADFLFEFFLLKLRINPIQVLYLSIGIIHGVAVRISMLLTACIALERCACVVFPLHIKRLITHRRVSASVIFCYVFGLSDLIPTYFTSRLDWVYFPTLNMTILSNVMMDDFYSVGVIIAPLKVAIFLITPVIIVSLSTVVLIRHLRRSVIFRQKVSITSSGNMTSTESAKTKEARVVKMVITICLLFIICYIPNTVLVMLIYFTSEVNLPNSNQHDTQVIYYSGFLLDTINSSVNIWIYYINGSIYKKYFIKTFHF